MAKHPGLYYKRTVKTLPKQMIRMGRALTPDPLSRKFWTPTGPVRYKRTGFGVVKPMRRTIIRKRVPTKFRTGGRTKRRGTWR